jgi:DNA-binding NarL/FixJ family response regulator
VSPIRVVIADDEMLVRQGLRRLLELSPKVEVVADASDGDQAVAAIVREQPDVVLLDVRMPKRNGIEVLRTLAERSAVPPTLLLTTFDDTAVLIDGLRAGARGYLLKDVSLDQLLSAIETLAAGRSLFLPGVTEHLLENFKRGAQAFESLDPPFALTARERTVLQLLAGGYNNREIAQALNTREGTVKNQVSSILSKLGVRDRTRAVLKAIEGGLL